MSSGAAQPTRLINTKVNPYWGMVAKNSPQTAVYVQGQKEPPGFEGGQPVWIPIDFPAVAAFDTQDSLISLPENFTLLTLLRQSTQPAAGFAFQLYEKNAQEWFGSQLVEAGLVAGAKGFALIDRVPHSFDGDEPQILVRVVNQAAATADIQVALYGIIGGAQD